MQKGTVLNFKKCDRFFKFFIENKLLIFFGLLFLVSFLFSLFFYEKNKETTAFFENYFSDFLSLRSKSGFLHIVTSSFFSSMLFVTATFCFGASMFGIIFVPLVFALAGFVYGGFSALLYSEYSLNGIAFWAISVLPAAALFIIGLLLASVESIKFSYLLARLCFYKDRKFNVFDDFKKYYSRFLIIVCLILLSAFVDALISINFLKNFNL